jgi:hypothetical protein
MGWRDHELAQACELFSPGQEIKYRIYVNWLICPHLSSSAATELPILKACANSATPSNMSSPYLRNHPPIASAACEAATMPSAAATGNK